MDSTNQKKPYGINVTITPGKYAPSSLQVGITEDFAQKLTKTVSELASNIALESYKNLMLENPTFEQLDKYIEMSKSTKHTLDRLTDAYFPEEGPITIDTFNKIEYDYMFNKEFMLNSQRKMVPYIENTKQNEPSGYCCFYGADVYEDTVDYFMNHPDTKKLMKLFSKLNENEEVINAHNKFFHLHVIPEYAGWTCEFAYKCFYRIRFLNSYETPVEKSLDITSKLIKNLKKIDSVCIPELRTFEPRDDNYLYEVVISFFISANDYINSLDPEEIYDKFSHKINWWNEYFEKAKAEREAAEAMKSNKDCSTAEQNENEEDEEV